MVGGGFADAGLRQAREWHKRGADKKMGSKLGNLGSKENEKNKIIWES